MNIVQDKRAEIALEINVVERSLFQFFFSSPYLFFFIASHQSNAFDFQIS